VASKHDLRNFLADATARGWTVDTTKGGHIRLRHPNGGLAYGPSTPSDHRGLLNLAATLRRLERQHGQAAA
jgi:predicted RNA binding protein YcfA (HicA-like mRNA interferase family)